MFVRFGIVRALLRKRWVRSVAGNSNKDHEYVGKQLTDEQRWLLVEFLKTL
jgi:hypothetical protein